MSNNLTDLLTGANALGTVYGVPDGGVDGDHAVTIPANFDKLQSALLATMSCVQSLSNIGSLSNTLQGTATANSQFQVHQNGSALLAANPPGAQTYTQNALNFTAPLYTGSALAALASGTYAYIPSLAPGWMLAREMFTDAGQVIGTQRRGLRLTWDLAAALANTTNPGTGVGVTPALGGGDLPGVYQVLTRQFPIEEIRNRSIHLRLDYDMPAVVGGVTIAPYVAYSDGATRFEAVGSPLQLTTGRGVTTLSTTDTTFLTDFAGGVVPSTATSVEVGIVMTGNTAGAGTLAIDLYEFRATVGAFSGDIALAPAAQDLAETQMHYANILGTDITGDLTLDSVNVRDPLYQELITAGSIVAGDIDVATNVLLRPRYPWALPTAWRTFDATVTPDVRFVESIGAVASVVTGGPDNSAMTTANNTIAITVTNAHTPLAAAPPSVRGLTASLDRVIQVQPTAAGSELLDRLRVGPVRWDGVINLNLAPLLF